VVIALGTHQGMSEDHLARHMGYSAGAAEETYPGWSIINHESWLPETFTTLGRIGAERLSELTGGLIARYLGGRADQPAWSWPPTGAVSTTYSAYRWRSVRPWCAS
jgi:hypothetical protein